MAIFHSKWLALSLLVIGMVVSNYIGTWAYLPFILQTVYHYTFPPTYSTKSASVVNEELKQKLASVIRTGIQLIGVLTVLGGFGVQIPYIEQVSAALQYLANNLNIAADAFNILAGVGITLYGFFKQSERFDARTDNPHKDFKLDN